MENAYGNYVIKKIKEAKIDKVIFYPVYCGENIQLLYDDILPIRITFSEENLNKKLHLWRREILRAVLGDETISIADDKVVNFDKYIKTLLKKDIVIFIGENINNHYNKKILGIVGKNVPQEKAFFPSASEVFQKSNDKKEEELFAESQPH